MILWRVVIADLSIASFWCYSSLKPIYTNSGCSILLLGKKQTERLIWRKYSKTRLSQYPTTVELKLSCPCLKKIVRGREYWCLFKIVMRWHRQPYNNPIVTWLCFCQSWHLMNKPSISQVAMFQRLISLEWFPVSSSRWIPVQRFQIFTSSITTTRRQGVSLVSCLQWKTSIFWWQTVRVRYLSLYWRWGDM